MYREMAGIIELSEQELLRRVAEGSSVAFKILYDKYQKQVYNKALFLLRSETLAEEVLQEVMLKLWQNADKLDGNSNVAAYLTTLTKNRSFQFLRRKVLEAKTNILLGQTWSESHNETEEQIFLEETRSVLANGIAQLPPQQKLVYELCHQKGLKYEEVALQLQLSPETVKSYMKLSLRFLRNYIARHTDVAAILIILKLF